MTYQEKIKTILSESETKYGWCFFFAFCDKKMINNYFTIFMSF